MLSKKTMLYVFATMCSSYSAVTHASLTCSNALNGTANVLLNGIPTASATEDLPAGTSIFQGRIQQGDRSQVFLDCKRDDPGSTLTDQVETKTYAIVKGGTLSGIDDHTYKTNIDGIGVRYWIYGDYIRSKERDISPNQIVQKWSVPPGGSVRQHFENIKEMTFWLVKTGPVKAGAVNGVSFPSVEYSVKSVGPAVMKGLPNIFQKFTFSGTYSITTPTCVTPSNVNVDLGNFDSTYFNTKNNSEWKDAKISLTGCGTFTGFQAMGSGDSGFSQPGSTGNYNVGNSSLKPYANNVLGITLNSNQRNIDISKGIVDIRTGQDQAKGIAVQIANGTTATNTPLVLNKEFTQTLLTNGTRTVNIPLVVRLIKQGSDAVSAGRVNANITYTINYR